MDKETGKQMREGEELRNLVIGNGWGVATKILDDMILALDSISTVPDELTIEQTAIETISRKRSIELIKAWRAAIDGRIANYEAFLKSQLEQTQKEDPYVVNRE